MDLVPTNAHHPQKHCKLYSHSLPKTHAALTSNWWVIFSTPAGTAPLTTRHVKCELAHNYITTHHWLQRLGVAWVLLLLLLLWGSRGGGVVGGLGLGGGRAAVRHGQLTQVGGVWGENWGTLAAVQTSFSWERERQKVEANLLSCLSLF